MKHRGRSIFSILLALTLLLGALPGMSLTAFAAEQNITITSEHGKIVEAGAETVMTAEPDTVVTITVDPDQHYEVESIIGTYIPESTQEVPQTTYAHETEYFGDWLITGSTVTDGITTIGWKVGNGASLAITPHSDDPDVLIEKVVFWVGVYNEYADAAQLSVSSGTITEVTGNSTGSTITVENIHATSVTLFCSGTTPDTTWVIGRVDIVGYEFSEHDLTIENTGTPNEYRFTMPNGSVSILVNYRELPHFVGHSLSLDGDIGVYFYVDCVDVDPQYLAVQFDWGNPADWWEARWDDYAADGEWIELETKTKTCDRLDVEDTALIGGKTYRKMRVSMFAREMNDKIYAVLYDTRTGSSYDINHPYDVDMEEEGGYSVQDYAMHLYNAEDAELIDLIGGNADAADAARLRELCRSMLIYGAKAQLRFGYYQDGLYDAQAQLADAELTNKTLEPIPSDVAAAFPDKYSFSACGTNFIGYSLVLLSKTSFRLYFQKDTQPPTATLQNSPDPNIEVKTGVNPEGYPYVEIRNIPAKYIMSDFTLKFADDTIQTVSAKAYVKSAMSANEETKNVATAIYRYCEAAEAYFDN